MMNIQNSRPLTAVCTGLLVCAVVACGRRDNAADRGNAAAVTDSSATSSLGGTVVIAPTDTTPAAADTAGYAHQPIPGARATAATAARRTSSMGGAVPARRTATRRSAVTPATGPEPLVVITGVRDEDYLAEPQLFNVVLLANMGDSAVSARAICLPVVSGNEPVRIFAQRMVREHAQLNERVVALQRSQNIAPTRSEVSDQIFSQNSDGVRSAESAQDYLAREVRSHQAMLSTLDVKLIPNARDSAFRTALRDARQLVESHLTAAQQLQSGAPAQPASVSTTPPSTTTTQPAPLTEATPAPPANQVVVTATAPALSGQVNATPLSAPNAPPYDKPATAPANPCDTPAVTAVPGPIMHLGAPLAPVRPDTSRGYDSRAIMIPAPLDTTKTMSDTLRIRP